MKNRRYLSREKNGSSTILDAIIAIGIAVAFFIVFIYYTNSLYAIQDEPGIDLEVKSVGLMETLINSPGHSESLYPEWQEEENSDILKALGLGTSHTLHYGTLQLNDKNVTQLIDGPYPESNSIGNDNTCFLAGTQIVMADESYKNIEDIKVGDFVKSYNEKNQRIEDKQVTHILHHTPGEMGDYYLVINNQLRVTPNHRFYVEGDWIFADELKIGDSLFYPSTDYAVYSIEKIFERTYTYNFEVEGHHNYFVAMESTDILVHNPQLDNFIVEAIPPEASAPYTIIFHCSVKETIPNFPYRYMLDYGDGSEIEEVITSIDPVDIPHLYTEVGNYDISIVVTNNIGEKGWFNISDLTIFPGPVADFTWFDKDGPFNSGTTITCNASTSSYSGDTPTFDWYVDGSWKIEGEIVDITLADSNKHNLKLKLTDDYGNSVSHIIEVQANILPSPDIDSKPWVLTGKEIYPDIDSNTFQSYLNDYYVKYTPLEAKGDFKYLLFEVKEKTNNEKPIIDITKIENLVSFPYDNYQSYNNIKGALGLDSKNMEYNFCINIAIYDENGDIDSKLFFGAQDDNNLAKASTTRKVLVYHPPTAKQGIGESGSLSTWVIDSHPNYKQAEITISVFLGGTPPPI
jgi:hypothetical protein